MEICDYRLVSPMLAEEVSDTVPQGVMLQALDLLMSEIPTTYGAMEQLKLDLQDAEKRRVLPFAVLLRSSTFDALRHIDPSDDFAILYKGQLVVMRGQVSQVENGHQLAKALDAILQEHNIQPSCYHFVNPGFVDYALDFQRPWESSIKLDPELGKRATEKTSIIAVIEDEAREVRGVLGYAAPSQQEGKNHEPQEKKGKEDAYLLFSFDIAITKAHNGFLFQSDRGKHSITFLIDWDGDGKVDVQTGIQREVEFLLQPNQE
ncbi:hypothetical protein HYS48_01520 [Candidatus Woesearchaeota archaeon]|nr:hypothetical protein [Candidatus Woesearchaeota archaeon]